MFKSLRRFKISIKNFQTFRAQESHNRYDLSIKQKTHALLQTNFLQDIISLVHVKINLICANVFKSLQVSMF